MALECRAVAPRLGRQLGPEQEHRPEEVGVADAVVDVLVAHAPEPVDRVVCLHAPEALDEPVDLLLGDALEQVALVDYMGIQGGGRHPEAARHPPK